MTTSFPTGDDRKNNIVDISKTTVPFSTKLGQKHLKGAFSKISKKNPNDKIN